MKDETPCWFASRIFKSRSLILAYLENRGVETYIPRLNGRPVMTSLVFVHCARATALVYKHDWFDKVMLYSEPGHGDPKVIPEEQVETLRELLRIKDLDLLVIENPEPAFLVGQKVRVLEGPLKGFTGVVKRIKGDRRLVIAIEGVVAVATAFIHPSKLENVEEKVEE